MRVHSAGGHPAQPSQGRRYHMRSQHTHRACIPSARSSAGFQSTTALTATFIISAIADVGRKDSPVMLMISAHERMPVPSPDSTHPVPHVLRLSIYGALAVPHPYRAIAFSIFLCHLSHRARRPSGICSRISLPTPSGLSHAHALCPGIPLQRSSFSDLIAWRPHPLQH